MTTPADSSSSAPKGYGAGECNVEPQVSPGVLVEAALRQRAREDARDAAALAEPKRSLALRDGLRWLDAADVVAELTVSRAIVGVIVGRPSFVELATHLATRAETANPSDGAKERLLAAAVLVSEVVNPPERTPERVLRAMLKAYEVAALARVIDKTPDRIRSGDGTYRLEWCASALRRYIGDVRHQRPLVLDEELLIDYEARLAGTRPLDAPPMEG